MLSENESIVRQLFEEVLNNGDVAFADMIMSRDSVNHGPSMIGCDGGAEGFKQTVKMFRNAMPDLNYSVHEIIATEDRVMARWTLRGTQTGVLRGIKPTNKHVLVTGVIIYRIAAGEIQESWGNWDALGMMLQLGVLPMTAVTWAHPPA
jgi:steroid delta-isomerase-like uncharacterized protein